MKNSLARINIILALLFLPLLGCKTPEEKAKAKQATFLRLFLETNRDGTPHNYDIQVYRKSPITMTVERDAVLDEDFMQSADLVDVDALGGFAIKIVFTPEGARRLDTLTISNKGKHLAVQARWTETRWLAAPLITKRISNGVFIFTPDATREEAERIVGGLKNVIKKLQAPYVF
jgi:preprotein translocase subunit SecD